MSSGISTLANIVSHHTVWLYNCGYTVLLYHSAEALSAMFTLLDAFGNSRTVLNTSATRYTSLLSLDFDHAGIVAAASVQALMLEKTRVTRRPDGEPTFHVFYQMLAGVDSQLRLVIEGGRLKT